MWWSLSATILLFRVSCSLIPWYNEGLPVSHSVILASSISMLQVCEKGWSRLRDCTEPLQACQKCVKVLRDCEDGSTQLVPQSLKWLQYTKGFPQFRHHASALSASTMYLVRSDGFALHLSLYCSKQGSILVVISITLCKWSFKELTVVWLYLWVSLLIIEPLRPSVLQPLKSFFASIPQTIHLTA